MRKFLIGIAAILMVIAALRGLILPGVPEKTLAMYLAGGFIIVVSLIWILWMFKIIRLVVVEEGTAVVFKTMGKFSFAAMEFSKHYFDTQGTVCEGDDHNYGKSPLIYRFGGWIFYIWPFVKPANYADYNEPDKFGDGVCIHLGDITPEPFVTEAETAAPENVPLNIRFVSTMKVVNPYLWLFVSPMDVYSQVVKRQDAVLRAWVRSGDQEHAQAARGDGKKLWEEIAKMGCHPVFKKIEDDWGLRIVSDSIVVEDVGYDDDYQKALKAKSQAKLEADAAVEETAGRIIKTAAEMLGLSVERLKAKLNPEPEKLKKLKKLKPGQVPVPEETYLNRPEVKKAFEYAMDQVKRDRAASAGELYDLRVGSSDGTPLNGQLGGLAAVAALFGHGGGFGGGGGGKGGGKQNPPQGGSFKWPKPGKLTVSQAGAMSLEEKKQYLKTLESGSVTPDPD